MPEVDDNRVNVKRKPDWLKTKLQFNSNGGGNQGGCNGGNQGESVNECNGYASVARIVERHGVHTICESGHCPNRIECWSRRTATFMVLGDVCTRACKFCATTTGKPLPLDTSEPQRVARSVSLMGLKHAVITSVTRDDLPDGGAAHWAAVVRAVREACPDTTIEVLIPDFGGDPSLLDTVLAAKPDITGHNIETVARLTPSVRSRARYGVSLEVLRHIAKWVPTTNDLSSEWRTWRADRRCEGEDSTNSTASTEQQGGAAGAPLSRQIAKSGLMVGLGETPDEVLGALDDLRSAGVSIVTLGQYLRPTMAHMPVAEYVTPEMFEFYKREALARGFSHVASGPLVRSSYMAEAALADLNRAAV